MFVCVGVGRTVLNTAMHKVRVREMPEIIKQRARITGKLPLMSTVNAVMRAGALFVSGVLLMICGDFHGVGIDIGSAWARDPFYAPLDKPQAPDVSGLPGPPTAEPTAPPFVPGYRVAGVIVAEGRQGKQVAALRFDNGQIRVFALGDRLPDGAIVRAIRLDRVVIVSPLPENKEFTLEVPR